MKFSVLILTISLLLCQSLDGNAAGPAIRIGYFGNITHAQAIVGKANATFEKKSGRKIEWKMFNAGPSAMEALLAGAIDMAYVGPNPALNAYMRSRGTALRIIAGAASGGASLVVQPASGIRTAADLKGKKVATPEFGNTQDIALRHWLKKQGVDPKKDLQIMTIKNPEILDLFQQKKIVAAWVPEPWVARLVHEAGGVIMLDERTLWPEGKFPTAVLVSRLAYMEKNRELVKKVLDAHMEVSGWINRKPEQAKKLINVELAKITRKQLPDKIIDDSFSRLIITHDPSREALLATARRAVDLGFLPAKGAALEGIFDLTLLNENLARQRLPQIK